jgi:hypothetical protein
MGEYFRMYDLVGTEDEDASAAETEPTKEDAETAALMCNYMPMVGRRWSTASKSVLKAPMVSALTTGPS